MTLEVQLKTELYLEFSKISKDSNFATIYITFITVVLQWIFTWQSLQ